MMKINTFILSSLLLAMSLNANNINAQEMHVINEDIAMHNTEEEQVKVEKIENKRMILRTKGSNAEVHESVFTIPNGSSRFKFSPLKIVKDAPYSAEVITENIRILADGNKIVTKKIVRHYRDSQGRTRVETLDKQGEIQGISIQDNDSKFIALNPKEKTMLKVDDLPEFSSKGGSKIISEKISKNKDGIQVIELEMKSDPNSKGERKVIVKREFNSQGAEGKILTINVVGNDDKVSKSEFNWNAGGALTIERNSALEGSLANILGDMKWAAKSQSKSLGSRDFDGVSAEGKLVTYEIPAGEIGNEKAIIVSTETWTSPQLQIVVYSKSSDPRSGDKIYRLNNLKRGEVDSKLFEIPSDYKARNLKDIKSANKAIKIEKIEVK
jgi:hypothetical protein